MFVVRYLQHLFTMSHAEIELKLLLPGTDSSRVERQLRALKVFGRRQSQVHWLWNVYYDTPDQLLRQQRHALRMRRISDKPPISSRADKALRGDWIQTFKSAGMSQGGLSQRGEWESQETSDRLNPIALKSTPWKDLDPDGLLLSSLQPCFETNCRRTTWLLRRYQGASIEVALDVGEIRAGGRSSPILELELELKSGPRQALFHLAETIAQEIGVLPCDASKAERGYRLASGATDPATRAKSIRLRDRIEPREAASLVLSDIYGQFTQNLSALCTEDDPEVVHQARVAWRRWTSALRVFSPWLTPRPDASGLKPLRTLLGQLRDLDVLRIDTMPTWLPLFAGNDAQRQQIADKALLHVDQARVALRAQARFTLSAPSTGMALVSLAQELSVLAAADPSQESLTDETQTPKSGKAKRRHKGHGQWAPKRMSSLRQRLERASRAGDLPGADLGDIHRMRLQAKQVRYAAEILSDLLPKKSTSALAKKAIKIQKKIGDDRDLQQVVSLLSALDLEPTLQAFFGGVLAARNSSIDAALKSKK